MLPDVNAEQGTNCDLPSGILKGLPAPEPIVDLHGVSPVRDYVFFPTVSTQSFFGTDVFGSALIINAIVDSVMVWVNGSKLVRLQDFTVDTNEISLIHGSVGLEDVVEIMVSSRVGITSQLQIAQYLFFPHTAETVFYGHDDYDVPMTINPDTDTVGVFVNGSLITPEFDFVVEVDKVLLSPGTVNPGDVVEILVISPPDTPHSDTHSPPTPYVYQVTGTMSFFTGFDALGNFLTIDPATQHTAVYANGARLVNNYDYTVSSNTIGLSNPLQNGDVLVVSVMPTMAGIYVGALPASGTAQRAYRIPADANSLGRDVWLPLPSPYSSVVKSPLAQDAWERWYWSNPDDPGSPYFSPVIDIAAHVPPYNLGMVYPDPTQSVITVTASGGTPPATAPFVGRSYCFTYVDQFGNESAPSLPTPVVEGATDGTWTITGLPLSAPPNPAGKNYPPTIGLILYRTASSASTGGEFFEVTRFFWGTSSAPTSPYVDTVSEPALTTHLQMVSGSFANPVAGLDGLTALPGGMLVGFTKNVIHFCEPDRPHAWPAGYDQAMQHPIKALGVWQQSLVVATEGFPLTGSGPNPTNFIFTLVRVPEPCIARGSLVVDLAGVYYASQNGIVMLSYFGMTNQTLSIVTKNEWLTKYRASRIIACRHRSQYLAIDGHSLGFLIDYSEQRLGLMPLSPMKDVVCVWNDDYSGDAYMIADNIIYRWDSPHMPPLMYRWRSKQFYLPAPISLAALQISSNPNIGTVLDPGLPPLDNGDDSLVLPDGVNAVCHIFAGPDGRELVATRDLMTGREIFRSPAGFMSFTWQIEIVARSGVRSIELATSMRELKTVG